ncbi:MAG: Trypco2 protein [Thermoproteota archaeon]|nr:Trypco2 protein [Thermoproteota archaeon]
MSKDIKPNTIVELISYVKQAIQEAQIKVKNIKVVKVDLEIKSSLQKGIGADGKISWLPIPINISGEYSQASIQTISMSLVPEEKPISRKVKGGPNVAEELASEIENIANGASEAANSEPRYTLSEATATINFGTDKSGKIIIFIGPEYKNAIAHTIKLTLKRVS